MRKMRASPLTQTVRQNKTPRSWGVFCYMNQTTWDVVVIPANAAIACAYGVDKLGVCPIFTLPADEEAFRDAHCPAIVPSKKSNSSLWGEVGVKVLSFPLFASTTKQSSFVVTMLFVQLVCPVLLKFPAVVGAS